MANMQENRSAFEDHWRDAFENAEMTPSEGLWKNLDNQLTLQENGKYRRGFIFYRSLAAACVVCLLGLGYYVLQDRLEESTSTPGQQTHRSQPGDKKSSEPEAAQQATLPPSETTEVLPTDNATGNSPGDRVPERESSAIADHAAKTDKLLPPGDNTVNGNSQEQEQANQAMAFAKNKNATPSETAPYTSEVVKTPSPGYLAALGPDTDQEVITTDWVHDINRLYRVPQTIVKNEKEKQERGLFAGINLATNYFDPNFSQGGAPLFSAAADESSNVMLIRQLDQYSLGAADSYQAQAANNGVENRPQLSFSYGVDAGMMLSKHLSLESGIDFGRMNSSTSTQLVAEDFSQGERIPLLLTNAQQAQDINTRTQFTLQEQQLTNSFDIISVPLKLGYNLQFHRFNLILSSGVAANFFLNNRLSDNSGQLNTVNVSSGSEGSPFRLLYYSGIISGGLNYLLTDHYAISVAPNYNFALSALTESGYNFSSQPNNFGIDFGIRYLFKN